MRRPPHQRRRVFTLANGREAGRGGGSGRGYNVLVWDEPRRAADSAEHGLDFIDARERFPFEDAVILPSYAGPDGRPRFVALGGLDGRLVAAVFSPLGTEAISLISLRPASRKERRIYENA